MKTAMAERYSVFGICRQTSVLLNHRCLERKVPNGTPEFESLGEFCREDSSQKGVRDSAEVSLNNFVAEGTYRQCMVEGQERD